VASYAPAGAGRTIAAVLIGRDSFRICNKPALWQPHVVGQVLATDSWIGGVCLVVRNNSTDRSDITAGKASRGGSRASSIYKNTARKILSDTVTNVDTIHKPPSWDVSAEPSPEGHESPPFPGSPIRRVTP